MGSCTSIVATEAGQREKGETVGCAGDGAAQQQQAESRVRKGRQDGGFERLRRSKALRFKKKLFCDDYKSVEGIHRGMGDAAAIQRSAGAKLGMPGIESLVKLKWRDMQPKKPLKKL